MAQGGGKKRGRRSSGTGEEAQRGNEAAERAPSVGGEGKRAWSRQAEQTVEAGQERRERSKCREEGAGPRCGTHARAPAPRRRGGAARERARCEQDEDAPLGERSGGSASGHGASRRRVAPAG